MIKEFDPVVLTESLPDEGLEAGDVGWVVLVHHNGTGFEIEFMTLTGETVSVVTVRAHAVRPVASKEIVDRADRADRSVSTRRKRSGSSNGTSAHPVRHPLDPPIRPASFSAIR
jgi:hypothetical protein